VRGNARDEGLINKANIVERLDQALITGDAARGGRF